MATSRRRVPRGPDVLFGYLIPLVIIGLTVADFIQDGQIDKYLIGACMIFGLGALGYRIDTLIERYISAKSNIAEALAAQSEEEEEEPPPKPVKKARPKPLPEPVDEE